MEAAESLIEAKNSGISSSLIITNAEVCAAGTIASKGNRENAGLSRTVNPGQGVRCIVALVLGAGASVRILNTPSEVSTLAPTHHRVTKALASAASAK